MLCMKCAGAGKFLGNGMLLDTCPDCKGSGDYEQVEPVKIAIDKGSKAYKDAVKEIMDSSPGMSRADAVKMFEDTYDQV